MTATPSRKARLLALSAFAALAAAGPALAAGPTGNASGYDLSVHVNLLLVTQLNIDAQAPVQITDAVATIADTNQLNGIDVHDPLSLIKLQTGLLKSDVAYAGGDFAAVAAQGSVTGLNLSAVSLIAAPVLAVTADVVASRSVLAGSCPPPPARPFGTSGLLDDFVFFNGFDAGGLMPVSDDGNGGGQGGLPGSGATLGNLGISLLGINVPVPLNPAPNTTVDIPLGIVGATLVLNEQTIGGDGVHSLSMSSNGVHLTLNVANLVTAEVIIAHSEASLSCP